MSWIKIGLTDKVKPRGNISSAIIQPRTPRVGQRCGNHQLRNLCQLQVYLIITEISPKRPRSMNAQSDFRPESLAPRKSF